MEGHELLALQIGAVVGYGIWLVAPGLWAAHVARKKANPWRKKWVHQDHE